MGHPSAVGTSDAAEGWLEEGATKARWVSRIFLKCTLYCKISERTSTHCVYVQYNNSTQFLTPNKASGLNTVAEGLR